jgi:hypothetical protein
VTGAGDGQLEWGLGPAARRGPLHSIVSDDTRRMAATPRMDLNRDRRPTTRLLLEVDVV